MSLGEEMPGEGALQGSGGIANDSCAAHTIARSHRNDHRPGHQIQKRIATHGARRLRHFGDGPSCFCVAKTIIHVHLADSE